MSRTFAVIGTNFGDEGKGLITDFLCSNNTSRTIVVRSNGGAQAAHTVVSPGGKRHVFSHFSSGTMCEAHTYLSKFFVVHPINFFRELRALWELGFDPMTYVDRECIVTTPFDVFLNQVQERIRGDKKHGSCGVGFGETIERCIVDEFKFTVQDLRSTEKLEEKLANIRDVWFTQKYLNLFDGIGPDAKTNKEYLWLKSDVLLNKFVTDCEKFYLSVMVVDSWVLNTVDNVVFEGAQGLLLDQNGKWFPHVTRSNTGLKNICSIADEVGIDTLDVRYVTRAYFTRHGAGPLPNEVEFYQGEELTDLTNVPNEWQGSLRYAWLDLDLMKESIEKDLGISKHSKVHINPCLALTCLDQMGDYIPAWCYGNVRGIRNSGFTKYVASYLGLINAIQSTGPTRNDVGVV